MSIDWQTLSDSAIHHPGLAFGFGVVLLGWLALRAPRSSLRLVLGLLLAETMLDAYFTGALSPLPKTGALAQNVGIAFVILGDFRYFVLLERFRRPDATWTSSVLRALAWSLVVPVLQALAIHAFPDTFVEVRRIYLVYEALFCALAAGLLVTRFPSRAAHPVLGWYLTRLTVFVLVQYGLWVLCDVLILGGHSWALGLRLVPNALYYGLFLYAAAVFAPEESWR